LADSLADSAWDLLVTVMMVHDVHPVDGCA